jgi:hypothetical protein
MMFTGLTTSDAEAVDDEPAGAEDWPHAAHSASATQDANTRTEPWYHSYADGSGRDDETRRLGREESSDRCAPEFCGIPTTSPC